MKLEICYREQARRLHETCPVVDAHLDLAGELLYRVQNGEANPLRDHYLKSLRAGGVDLVVSSVYLEDEQLPEGGLRAALNQISVLHSEIARNPEFMEVRTAADLEQAFRENQIGVILYMEGLDCIGRDIRLLPILWELGVRGASLTWSRRNLLASGCCKGSERSQIPGGLSPDGILAVREMERLGMFLDVSHLNDDGFEDLCRIAETPFIATHSNSREVFFHYRNLTDSQMERLAGQGGVMGLNGCGCIAGCDPSRMEREDTLEMLCRHVEYEAARIGAEHVGYGFDFCDSYTAAKYRLDQMPRERRDDCLGDHSHLLELTTALLQRGMKEEDVKKIIGGNFVEYFRRVLP